MNETKTNLIKALIAFQEKIQPVTKGSENPFFRSTYASLTDIWLTVQPVLTANGLAISQTTRSIEQGMEVITTLYHSSGEEISGAIPVFFRRDEVVKGEIFPHILSMQEVGSAITYARRYGLSAILGIVTDEDDDGNSASKKTPEAKETNGHKFQAPEITIKLGDPIPKPYWALSPAQKKSVMGELRAEKNESGVWMAVK